MRHLFRASLLLLLALVALHGNAQLVLSNTASPATVQVCSSGSFSVSVARSSGTYAATDSVVINLAVPAGMEWNGTVTSSVGTVAVRNASPSAPQFAVLGLSGGAFTFTYALKASCSRFSSSTSGAVSNTVTASFNSLAPQTLASNTYNTSSAWMVFDPMLSVRLQYSTAPYLIPYVRHYVFRNTSPVPFTGEVEWKDSVQEPPATAMIQILGAVVSNPAATILSSSTTTSVASIRAQVTGLASGDSIVVRETVRIIGCPVGINKTSSLMTFRYGCQGDASLCTLNPVPNYQTWALLSGAPGIAMMEMDAAGGTGQLYYQCPANDEVRIMGIKNTGTAAADSLQFQLHRGVGGNISYFDRTEMVAYINTPGGPVILPQLTQQTGYAAGAYVPNTFNQPYSYRFTVQGPFAPGDTVFVRWIEHKVCIDSSDYDFDMPVVVNEITEQARFTHPCSPTGWSNPSGTYRGVWGWPIQKFDLGQVFENHTAYMEDEDEAWMRIDNKSPLVMGITHPYFPDEICIDPSKVQFKVEIQIDPGLGMIPDSIYLVSDQGGVDSIWWPTTLTVVYDDMVNSTNGSKIIATFTPPAYFFQPNVGGVYNNWGCQWRKSDDYLKFFNRFSVRFKVEAECDFAPPAASYINEQTYFVHDTTCVPLCQYPLSSVGTRVSVLCPGCRVPGWNIGSFSANRTTFGWQDSNNDNHADSAIPVPATAAEANEKRIMIGDEIEVHLTAFTSDGEVLLFNNIGFDYRFAELALLGRLGRDLEFIGGSGNLNGAAYFTFPASHGYYLTGDTFHFDLSIDTLASFVTSGSLPTKFWAGDFFDLTLRFRVIDNLVYGGQYFNLEDLDAFIYQSGVPIQSTLGDAGPTETSLPILPLTPAQRSQYFYWCTGGGGRLTAIGTQFTYQPYIDAFSGIWGVTGIDFCYKKLAVLARHEVGGPISGDVWYHDASNQSALNSFSYEVRDFIIMDSLSVVIPDDYELDHVDIRLSNVMLDTNTNQTRYICAPDWYTPFAYPMANVRQVDSTYTIFPSLFYQHIPSGFATACGSTALDRGDETKRVQVQFVIKMKDCKDVREVIPMGGYNTTGYVSNVPSQFGDTAIFSRNFAGYSLTAPKPKWNLQALPVNTTTSTPNLTWTLNIAVLSQLGYWYDRTTAPSVFVYPISPSGAIDITEVKQGSTLKPVIGTWAGEQAWGIGTIWQDNSVSLTVKGTYDCAAITGQDSLHLVVGWNCYGWPTSLAEACFTDTVTVYVLATEAGLVGTLSGPPSGGPCDTLDYELTLNATGLGNIGNVLANLPAPVGGEWQLIPGSSQVSVYGGAFTAITPVAGTYNLGALPAVAAGFNSSSGNIRLRFQVRTLCSYDLEDVAMNLSAVNYCGKPVSFTVADRPSVLSLPTSAITDSYAVSGLSCSIAGGIQFDIISPTATVNANHVLVDLPAGFTFVSNGTDTLSVHLPVGFSGILSVNEPVAVGGTFPCPSDHEVIVTQYVGTIVQCSPTEPACSRSVSTSTQTCNLHVGVPAITLAGDGSCKAGCTVLTATVTGGSGVYSYLWTDLTSSTVLASTADTVLVCPALDTVRYHVLVTDVTGCTAEASLAVERCCQPPVLTCNDTVIQFNQELCGPFTPAEPAIESDCIITSITSDWAGGAFPEGTTTVTWTVVNEFGDTSTCSGTVTYLPATLTSSYTLLATQRVKLMSNNDVLTGSVGVTSATGNAYIANHSEVTGAGSAVRAATLTTFPLTVITNPVTSAAPAAMPAFHFNTAGPGPDVNVPVNGTVTLTGSVYGTISLSKGATVIFSGSPVVNVQTIRVNNKAAGSGTTMRFDQCTEVRVKGRVDLGPTCSVNPTHQEVTFYVEAANTGENDAQPACDIGPNSVVEARIHVPNGILYVHPGSNVSPAIMKGQFTAKWINGQPDIQWIGAPDCDGTDCGSAARSGMEDSFTASGIELEFHPNPLRDMAHIHFSQPVTGEATLRITDMNGVTVAELFRGTAEGQLRHETEWQVSLPAGVYFLQLQTQQGTAVRKMVIVK